MTISRKHLTILFNALEETYISALIEETLAMSDAEIEDDLRAWGIDLDKSIHDFTNKLHLEHAERMERPGMLSDLQHADEVIDEEHGLCAKAHIPADTDEYVGSRSEDQEGGFPEVVCDSIRRFFETQVRLGEDEVADILAYLEYCCSGDMLTRAPANQIAKRLAWGEERVQNGRAKLLEHHDLFQSWLEAEHRKLAMIAGDAERSLVQIDTELVALEAKRAVLEAEYLAAKAKFLETSARFAARVELLIDPIPWEYRQILQRLREGDIRDGDLEQLESFILAKMRRE